MKVESKVDRNGNIVFDRFIVKKESENFYGVYEHFYGSTNSLITSGTTKDSACKKAKLLQIGFNIGSDYERS